MKKIVIKKELTEEEFNEIIVVCEARFAEVHDLYEISLGCEEKTKEISPAKEALVLLVNDNKKSLDTVTLDKQISIDLKKESILSECYQSKQPLIVNDVTRSFLYREKIDNFLDCQIKDLLLIPIVDDSADKNVMAIIWAAITKGEWNQYTQKDIDYMLRFTLFIKRFLYEGGRDKEHMVEHVFSDCMEAYDKLNAERRREQEYFSSIVHDVRTPMNAVLGFLELLNLKEEDKEKKEYLDVALKSGETMVALINDILDISKMSSGKMRIEKIAFSPLEELSDVAKLFHNTARKKGITLIAFYDPNLPKVIHSDYHRIKQVMNNLLSNAIKFTPEKGTITLELLYDKEHDGLTVSVKDSGIGIAKDMQKNIFTPYTQEKSSTSREYGGTGLGLSISQQLSVLLGGKLELESKEGKGSRFYFTIPCYTKENTPLAIDAKKLKELSILVFDSIRGDVPIASVKRYLKEFHLVFKEVTNDNSLKKVLKKKVDLLVISRDCTILYEKELQEIMERGTLVIVVGDGYLNENYHQFRGKLERLNAPILPHDLYNTIVGLSSNESKVKKQALDIELSITKGKRVLVVDDNSINLKFMREVLKIMHLETVLAQSAQESIEKFENESFDIIFMDENMPGMQGTEAIEHIRKMEKKKKLKDTVIIGLTGDADEETRERLLSIGANDVLTKPIQLKEIKKIMTKYL